MINNKQSKNTLHQYNNQRKQPYSAPPISKEEKNKINKLFTSYPLTSCMGRKWLYNHNNKIDEKAIGIITTNSSSSVAEDKVGSNSNGEKEKLGFTIVTYNILAQMYAKRLDMEPFSSIESYDMITSWAYRRKRLFREIKSYGMVNDQQQGVELPEIICFQECDNYQKYWRKKMNNKLKMYSTYTEKRGKRNGCATFWRTDRFVEVAYRDLDLAHLSNLIDKGKETNSMFGRRDTANLTLLQCKLSSRYLLIINNHLAWDPEYPQVKLSQMLYILQKAYKMIQPYNSSSSSKVSVVLTGDFNSLPNSEVYNLIVEGQAVVPTLKPLSFNSDCNVFTESSVNLSTTRRKFKEESATSNDKSIW